MLTDAAGRPLRFVLTGGERNDFAAAPALLADAPNANWLLADRGYDAMWIRNLLKERGITPCIPYRKLHNTPGKYDPERDRDRHRIENSFARLKDWRRLATRYDRNPVTFLNVAILAAIVMFWL
ncbi:DDE transposase [Sinisalibacter aestuarii]|uniref:DDE transposase n=2 Tax=Sinisalibacter aestuarii TaxID=2949426 RepID=A0ABQ5LRZ1_9RHOB|nr:DDE transposase [Sinisalibacter aestuarii]